MDRLVARGICGLVDTRDALGLRTRIVGVVTENASAAKLSYEAGKCIETNTAKTIADGMAVRVPVPEALEIYSRGAERIVAVSEEEVADGNRTDIWLSTTNGDQKAVIEVNIADRWTLADFERAFREQLVGKYLRHANCKAGCLLLTYHGRKKHWQPPETGNRIRFPELVAILRDKARTLEAETQYDARITVFGLDLTEPTPNDPGFEEKMAKAENIIGRYRNTLHVLSK